MAIEIVSFSMKNGGSFMVKLPDRCNHQIYAVKLQVIYVENHEGITRETPHGAMARESRCLQARDIVCQKNHRHLDMF